MRKLRILSIDGGGLRGVIPLQVIEYIEEITGRQIHELFDVIAGTSTGGLLACALLVEDRESIVAGSRKYSIQQIRDIYQKHGKDIFPAPSFLDNFRSYYRPKFDPTPLERTLATYFGELRIMDCLRPLFITSFDLKRNNPVYFTTREANLEPTSNTLLKEVCRATSAAPTYFPPHQLNYDRERLHCIDGGIFMNNPSLGVLSEVLANADSKYYQVEFIRGLHQIHLLSISTGTSTETLDLSKIYRWGKAQWARPVIDLAMSGPVGTVHDHLNVLFQLYNRKSNYHRVIINLDDDRTEMTDSSEKSLTYWMEAADSQVRLNRSAALKLRVFLEEAGVEVKV